MATAWTCALVTAALAGSTRAEDPAPGAVPTSTTARETVTTTLTELRCLEDPEAFSAGYGDCSVYREDGTLHAYCDQDEDIMTGKKASEVCAQCGKCSRAGYDPTMQRNDGPSTTPSDPRDEEMQQMEIFGISVETLTIAVIICLGGSTLCLFLGALLIIKCKGQSVSGEPGEEDVPPMDGPPPVSLGTTIPQEIAGDAEQPAKQPATQQTEAKPYKPPTRKAGAANTRRAAKNGDSRAMCQPGSEGP